MHVAKFTTGYMDNAIFDLAGTIDLAVSQLTPILDEFDTIVGTGFSGGMVIPMLATKLKKKFVLIRKETDDSHHGSGRLLGELGERWIFVDDFCQSGKTKRRVIAKIEDAADYELHETTYVGNYYYGGYRLDSDYRDGANIELLHPVEQVKMGKKYEERPSLETKYTGRDFGRSYRDLIERQAEAYVSAGAPDYNTIIRPRAFRMPSDESPEAAAKRAIFRADPFDVPLAELEKELLEDFEEFCKRV